MMMLETNLLQRLEWLKLYIPKDISQENVKSAETKPHLKDVMVQDWLTNKTYQKSK